MYHPKKRKKQEQGCRLLILFHHVCMQLQKRLTSSYLPSQHTAVRAEGAHRHQHEQSVHGRDWPPEEF